MTDSKKSLISGLKITKKAIAAAKPERPQKQPGTKLVSKTPRHKRILFPGPVAVLLFHGIFSQSASGL